MLVKIQATMVVWYINANFITLFKSVIELIINEVMSGANANNWVWGILSIQSAQRIGEI